LIFQTADEARMAGMGLVGRGLLDRIDIRATLSRVKDVIYGINQETDYHTFL